MFYPHILLPRSKSAFMNFVFFVDMTKSPLGFRINAPARMTPVVYHFFGTKDTSEPRPMSAKGGRQYFGLEQKRDKANVHDPVVVLHGTHISAADDDLAEKVHCLL